MLWCCSGLILRGISCIGGMAVVSHTVPLPFEPQQQVVIGTKVGRTKHMRIMPGGALETEQSLSGPTSVFVGKKLDDHRGSFLLEYPMDKGHVVDGGWDAMEALWEVCL